MKDEWPGTRYRLIGSNCQTFAKRLCSQLGLGDCIPPEYSYFADLELPVDIEQIISATLLDKFGSKSSNSKSSKS